MIKLGCFDAGVDDAVCKAYVKEVETLTRVPLTQIAAGPDRLELQSYRPDSAQPMPIAEVQRALRSIGFFPGGKFDGICGYRTQSAIRLFQEYVRSVEKIDCLPDGMFGSGAQAHLKRWLDQGLQPNWAEAMQRWSSGDSGPGEYADWLALLSAAREGLRASPDRTQQLVDVFSATCDTRKPAAWDVGAAGNIHLIGIRREEVSGKFDDIFVLLIKGLVFKFQGSTEPGATKNPLGLPFLVRGQHDYHFGWHQKKYLALRPLSAGVLVVRSRNDKRFDDDDLKNGLEPNTTINVHWAGKGMLFDVNSWSEGCQVVNGSLYVGPDGELVDCTSFAATNNDEVASKAAKTRGAYNVLVDLVTALASDLKPTVKYTLLNEADLKLAPDLKRRLAEVRTKVLARL